MLVRKTMLEDLIDQCEPTRPYDSSPKELPLVVFQNHLRKQGMVVVPVSELWRTAAAVLAVLMQTRKSATRGRERSLEILAKTTKAIELTRYERNSNEESENEQRKTGES